MASPDGCLPGVRVAASFGGFALEINDVELVVRPLLQRIAVLGNINRVRHQRDRTGRVDVEVHRWADDRVLQGQAGHDLRAFGIGEIDDQYLILAGRGQQRLAVIVPPDLLVAADDHERFGKGNIEAGAAEQDGRSQG